MTSYCLDLDHIAAGRKILKTNLLVMRIFKI